MTLVVNLAARVTSLSLPFLFQTLNILNFFLFSNQNQTKFSNKIITFLTNTFSVYSQMGSPNTPQENDHWTFSPTALYFQWENPKKNNTCHVAPPHRIDRRMRKPSVGGVVVLRFRNSLASDAFSFSSSLLLCSSLLCSGCLRFSDSQITRICTMIPNIKVRFFLFNFMLFLALLFWICRWLHCFVDLLVDLFLFLVLQALKFTFFSLIKIF